MESLTEGQIESIKKLSTARLSKLITVGYSEDTLEDMDRNTMLQAWAACVAAGKDKPAAAAVTAAVTPTLVAYDVDFEREKLKFEMSKFETERGLKQAEIESNEKIKLAELKIQEQKLASKQEEKKSIVILAKRYGEAIKASVTPMGPHMLDVVLFFRHIESVFDRYKVPDNLKAALLQPYLNDKSHSVVSRIDPLLCNDYVKVRDAILSEHKLSPFAYLDLFNSLSQSSGETTVMYCSKLKSLISMYVESRKVDNFQDLLSLIVCDRVKATLSDNCLRHVLSVESASTDGWLKIQQLAEAVDLYKANHCDSGRPHASAIGVAASSTVTNTRSGNTPSQSPRFHPQQHSQPQPQLQLYRRGGSRHFPAQVGDCRRTEWLRCCMLQVSPDRAY